MITMHSDFHKNLYGTLISTVAYPREENQYFDLGNVSHKFLDDLMNAYGVAENENGTYTLRSSTTLSTGEVILRVITLSSTEGKSFGCTDNKIHFTIKTKTPYEEFENKYYESMICWAIEKLEYYLNDWSIYPTNLNSIETLICNKLKELNINKTFYAKINTDDSIRQFNIGVDFLGYQRCARFLYNSIDKKYRDSIIDVENRDGDIYFVFENDDFYNEMNKYISAKSDWCSKYGCD